MESSCAFVFIVIVLLLLLPFQHHLLRRDSQGRHYRCFGAYKAPTK